MTEEFVLDSSTLISLSETCLFDVFRALHKKLDIHFAMSEGVVKETIQTPSTIKRFQLSAERIQKGVDQKWIKVVKLNSEAIALEHKIVELSKKLFHSNGKYIQIVHEGEAEALALLHQLNSTVLVIDEKTTRMLLENPQGLRELIEHRQQIKIEMDLNVLKQLQQVLPKPIIVRSSELIALAFEQNLLDETITNTPQSLKAALYAVRYAGCAVSEEEISKYLRTLDQ